MAGFDPTTPASGQVCCSSPCADSRAADDRLSDATAARIQSLTGEAVPPNAGPDAAPQSPVPSDADACTKKASTLAPVMQRFNRYRDALPSARAAADLNQLGDKPGDKPSSMPCLTRLPTDGAGLSQALGLPPDRIPDSNLRDDTTGFRAAMYRDESTNSLILVPRDTQPDSLVDWETNTRNGTGVDTEQYSQMRQLTGRLTNSGVDFDVAGYSKGGGLAQEAGLVNTDAQVTVFNSAGLHDNSLARTGSDDFDSLTARTKAFSAQGDFLTYMNTTTDPQQNLTNARFLRQELAGEGRGINPINIKTLNPATRGTKPSADFVQAKQDYLKELDDQIAGMQSALDEGRAVEGFPPVRAGMKETINDSGSFAGKLLGANSDQPTLGKLYQHKMDGVLDSLESNVKDDRKDAAELSLQVRLTTAMRTPFNTLVLGGLALAALLGWPGVRAASESAKRDTGTLMATSSSSSSGPQAALDQAISADDAAGISSALAAGAKVDARGPHGVTPLMAAVDRQKPRSVMTLLGAGADPNATADDGASPVSLAVENYRIKPHGQQIMMAVFKGGGRPDTRRPNGDPILMKFVNMHDCDGVRLMKSLGADLDARDRGGDPVITVAALGMDWDVVWCMIELGARFDYEHGGARDPLSLSLRNKAPSRSSPLFPYKEKVWQRLRDANIAVAPLPN